MTDNKHHYFFAIKLPNEVKTFLNRWVQMHNTQYPFKRWVHPEDYHITLAFLGFVEKNLLEKVQNQVGDMLKHEDSFDLTLDEIGTFGSKKSPRIFWAGVKESEELNLLQKKIFKICLESNLNLDKKPFNPHITLARKWESNQVFPSEKMPLLKNSEDGDFSFTVSEIALYETHLNRTPKYKEYALYTF